MLISLTVVFKPRVLELYKGVGRYVRQQYD